MAGTSTVSLTVKVTRWTPDTCPAPGCVIDYTWDSAVAVGSRTHGFSTVISACSAHGTLTSPTAIFNAAVDENSRKNTMISIAVISLPAVFPDATVPAWSFNASRQLLFSTPGILTAPQILLLQGSANTTFGTGKVIVQ